MGKHREDVVGLALAVVWSRLWSIWRGTGGVVGRCGIRGGSRALDEGLWLEMDDDEGDGDGGGEDKDCDEAEGWGACTGVDGLTGAEQHVHWL